LIQSVDNSKHFYGWDKIHRRSFLNWQPILEFEVLPFDDGWRQSRQEAIRNWVRTAGRPANLLATETWNFKQEVVAGCSQLDMTF
jgi:hypothetical protein